MTSGWFCCTQGKMSSSFWESIFVVHRLTNRAFKNQLLNLIYQLNFKNFPLKVFHWVVKLDKTHTYLNYSTTKREGTLALRNFVATASFLSFEKARNSSRSATEVVRLALALSWIYFSGLNRNLENDFLRYTLRQVSCKETTF